ncbi:V-type ATP synthase subunit C [Clostridium botulinum]|uniref:V-type ATP synthase subunit C n=1 Tax=Clostridium botulinum TaxID=1491 RepID=A0ABD7CHC9_CLOBO|nr:V-type ATP synthase subunit C [Clostridium botulinum]KGO14436.1 ATP synthase subunit C [Clostridium botulinum]KIN83187.1 ATP synthase subunit C [Clostridium botulinum]MCC5427372.1 V-type ATP synthase subunit C [Clostridium botulinum]QRI52535.1 V-type ATP synthase subunit C [Clostridium botulinum]
MDNLNYAHAVGRLRVLETKLLDRTKIERMIDSSSPEEVIKILEETEYSNYMASVNRPEDYEFILKEALNDLYKLMYEITPENLVVDVMNTRYDYHNIKVLIKEHILEKDLSNIYVSLGTVSISLLKEHLSSKKSNDVNPIMAEGISKALEAFDKDKDPQMIDIVLDSYMYKDMFYKASKLDDKFLKEYIKMHIDFTNIKTLLRAKKQEKDRSFLNEVIIEDGNVNKDVYMDLLNEPEENILKKLPGSLYEKIFADGIEDYINTGKLNYFEKLSDNFLMEYVKKAKYITFGLEPIIGFIIGKETEIKVLRIIIIGKLNSVAPEVIRERLRDIYV